MRKELLIVILALLLSAPTLAQQGQQGEQGQNCNISQGIVISLQSKLLGVAEMNNGGLFSPNRMW